MTNRSTTPRDLLIHKDGMEKIRKAFPYLVNSTSPGTDLVSLKTGAVIKVVVADYALENTFNRTFRVTPDMYLEMYNVGENNDKGGPWEAFEQNSNYFLYLFSRNNDLVSIQLTQHSIGVLTNLMPYFKEHHQPNNGYFTVGRIVPVSTLEKVLPQYIQRCKV